MTPGGTSKASIFTPNFFFYFLEELVLYFKKTFINFQYQNSYIIGFFSSQLVPKETTQKERTF